MCLGALIFLLIQSHVNIDFKFYRHFCFPFMSFIDFLLCLSKSNLKDVTVISASEDNADELLVAHSFISPFI